MAEPNTLLLALLFLAVAAGWVLGRGASGRDEEVDQTPPSQYYLGLNFLLDGEQESALKAFSEALAVNAETFETHITFGSLLRKRGEVDNAIKIHQSLLSRTKLPDAQKNQAHLELSKDFIAAGLLDRAEQLLKDLIELSEEHEADAKVLLLEVFEASRDWEQARVLAESQLKQVLATTVTPGSKAKADKIKARLCNYCCESAEDQEAKSEWVVARNEAAEGLRWDDTSIWPHLIMARIDVQEGATRQAFDRLMSAAKVAPYTAPSFPFPDMSLAFPSKGYQATNPKFRPGVLFESLPSEPATYSSQSRKPSPSLSLCQEMLRSMPVLFPSRRKVLKLLEVLFQSP